MVEKMKTLEDYFSHSELACKGSGVVKLDPRFADALLEYRETVGMPLHPNSCSRSRKHNTKVGGARSSYHLYEDVNDGRQGTMAIDLHVTNGSKRAIMIKTALLLGWSVGVYKTFIHIDRRIDLGKEQIVF